MVIRKQKEFIYFSLLSAKENDFVIDRFYTIDEVILDVENALLSLDSSLAPIEVLCVIEDIVKNTGATFMMITHNAEIAKMADRVVKVRSGKIASIRKNPHPLRA